MSRRHKKADDAALGFFLIIAIIAAVIYYASVCYGLIIIVPFLYYNVIKVKELNKSRDVFIRAREACVGIRSRINGVLASNSDLRETQRGDFDERSNRGRLANQEIARLEGEYSQSERILQRDVGIFRNAIFYRYALILYIFSLAALSYLKADLNAIPVAAAVISLIGGFVGRCTVREPLAFEGAPQLDAMPALAVTVVWLIACGSYYPQILDQASNNFNLISSPAPSQPPISEPTPVAANPPPPEAQLAPVSESSDIPEPKNVISVQSSTNNTTQFTIITTPASFDCNRARSTLEKLICADTELSSLDGMVGEAYSQIKKISPQGSDIRKVAIDEQRQFLKERMEACPIPVKPILQEEETRDILVCLKKKYTLRLQELTKHRICREYRRTTTLGNIQQVDGDIGLTCKNNDGDWQIQ